MKRTLITILLSLFAISIAACSGRVITSGNFTLKSGETINGDLTITSGNTTLESGSHVTGSLFITSGNLTVDGEVGGDILMTSGNIQLGPQAVVHGDITSTSGEIRQADGARVDGQVFTTGSGGSVDAILNVLGKTIILPIVVIVLVIGFIFRPGQRQSVQAKRPDESEETFDVAEKPKRGDKFMDSQNSRVTGGIVLIGLGVMFLLTQTGLLSLSGNWWAVFIALPAAVMLYNAYTGYQQAGQMTAEVRRNVSGGVVVGVVAIIALTGQWETLWPLFLIVPGVLMLMGFTGQKKQT